MNPDSTLATTKTRPNDGVHLSEVELARGATVKDASRKLAITEHTYYRWRREYGGLKLDQAKRLKLLEKENARLKKIVAEKELDLSILREVTEGNF